MYKRQNWGQTALTTGLGAGIGGIIMVAQITSAERMTGFGLEFEVYAALMIGGYSILRGGVGNPTGGALGILLYENSYFVLILAFVFGLISMMLVFFISKVNSYTNRLTLVLAGIVSSSFFLALVSMVKFLADPDDKLPAITYWLMGSFATASYEKIILVSPLIIICLILLAILGYRIDVLNLGDDHAKSLGLNVNLYRWLIIGLITIICAAVVSIAGVVAWVGLVVPHIARSFSKTNHKSLIINSSINDSSIF